MGSSSGTSRRLLALRRLLLPQNPLPGGPFDLRGVYASVGPVLRRHELRREAVRLIPSLLTLPALAVGRNAEHPQVLPVEDVAFEGDAEVGKPEVVRVSLRVEASFVVVADAEAGQRVGHDHFGLRAHEHTGRGPM